MVSENLEQALILTLREVRLLRQKYLPVYTLKHIHRRGPVQDGFLSIEPRHPTASRLVYKGCPMVESIASPTHQENPRFRKQRPRGVQGESNPGLRLLLSLCSTLKKSPVSSTMLAFRDSERRI